MKKRKNLLVCIILIITSSFALAQEESDIKDAFNIPLGINAGKAFAENLSVFIGTEYTVCVDQIKKMSY